MDREAIEGLLEALVGAGYVGKPIDLMIALMDALDGDCDLEDAPFVADYGFSLRERGHLMVDLRSVTNYFHM